MKKLLLILLPAVLLILGGLFFANHLRERSLPDFKEVDAFLTAYSKTDELVFPKVQVGVAESGGWFSQMKERCLPGPRPVMEMYRYYQKGESFGVLLERRGEKIRNMRVTAGGPSAKADLLSSRLIEKFPNLRGVMERDASLP